MYIAQKENKSMNCSLYLQFLFIKFMYSHSLNYSFSQFPNFSVYGVNREVKHDVNGRRQTAKITSDFEFFSSNP